MESTSLELLRQAETVEGSRALFRDVIEPLADAFDPALVDRYVSLFSNLIPGFDPAYLCQRFEELRKPRPLPEQASEVVILSRVTIGADIAVTSVLMDAALQRYPRVRFAGSRKNFELFGARAGVEFLEAPYARTGLLRDRIAAGLALAPALENAFVIDPDSRISQLGLLPIVPADRCLFFESRSYGGGGTETLTDLTKRFAKARFGVDARAFIAPLVDAAPVADIAISFGVGENPAKRVGDAFEDDLIHELKARGHSILLDSGAGGDEADRALALANRHSIAAWQGSFAAFAGAIAKSRFYIGYDSAGQHAASACGVPQVTIFAGHPSERMLQRWSAPGALVLRPGPRLLEETLAAVG